MTTNTTMTDTLRRAATALRVSVDNGGMWTGSVAACRLADELDALASAPAQPVTDEQIASAWIDQQGKHSSANCPWQNAVDAADEFSAQAAPKVPEAKAQAVPIGYISPAQQTLIVDPDDESGVYIPMRRTPKGKFTMALYAALQPASNDPMFWVRLRSDGGYEGPLHDSAIEDVRKRSGAWTPLYAGQPATSEQRGWSDDHMIRFATITLMAGGIRSDVAARLEQFRADEASAPGEQRKPLTIDRMQDLHQKGSWTCHFYDFKNIARAVETEHGIRSTGGEHE